MPGAGEGALLGGLIGGTIGAGIGALSGETCFLPGTQVAYARQERSVSALESAGSIAVAQVTYLTISIEKITKGFKILARDENDPFGPFKEFVVEEVFCRIAYHLRVLTIRMSDGRVQTIYTTDEHPAYEAETQWTPAGKLQEGDQLLEASGGMATVVGTRYEAHPGGIEVFNFRVGEAHTYLVRAEGFNGELIWVHNADASYLAMMEQLQAESDSANISPSLFEEVGIRPGDNVNLNQVSGQEGRSYITYTLMDEGQIVYVGRASGPGTPAEVLASRLAKGHDYFLEGMTPNVIDTQGTKLASQGAEEYFIQGYIEQGAPLRNLDNALSFDNAARTQRSLAKLEAFFNEN